MAFRLDQRVAAITGAASGIGAAMARVFVQAGAKVALLDVDQDRGEDLASDLCLAGGRASFHPCDVGDENSVQKAFSEVITSNGGLDILVNNAGIAHVGTVESTTEADLDRLYRVNVKGVFLCTRAAIPSLQHNGRGVIINMASIASHIGIEDRFAYSMTKGAVLSMTRSVAVDYMKKGIRCNCICPARVHTPFVDGFLAKNYPGKEAEMFAKLAAYQPLGRMGTPDEVALMALYLASDAASFITGQAFPLDGGVLVY